MPRLNARLREAGMLIAEQQLPLDGLQVSIPWRERVGNLEEINRILQCLAQRLGWKGLVALEHKPLQVVKLADARGQEFHDFPVLLFRGSRLGGPARFVERAGVGILAHQQLDQVAIALARRQVQRRFAGGVPGVDVRLAGKQQLRHFAVPVIHRHVEGRFLAQPARVDLRLVGQQQPRDLRLPLQGG